MKKQIVLLVVFLLGFGLVFGIPAPQPSARDEITKLLLELVETPGTLMTTEESFISFPENPISADSLIWLLSLSPDQVCLSLGEFGDSDEWTELVPMQKIRYVGEGSRAVKFSALCENGTNLESTVQRVGENKISLSDTENCDCAGKEKTCCVVVLTDSWPAEYYRPWNFLFLIPYLLILAGLVVVAMYVAGLVFLFLSKTNFLLKAVYLTKILLFIVGMLIAGILGAMIAFLPQIFLSAFGYYLASRTKEKRASKGAKLILIADLIAIFSEFFLILTLFA